MTQAILIPEGAEVAAIPKETPHRVMGEEARASQVHWGDELDPHRPLEGLAVDVEITDFPTVGRPARGRVIEVLGPPDAFGVDVEIIIASTICRMCFLQMCWRKLRIRQRRLSIRCLRRSWGGGGIFAGCRL